ncbi:thermonuclease family protein [Roseibium aquae]|uniref:thermonuclease family protein n=1 Tax=Roseibium aquae TaxID=1323746 RepID=UPI001FCBEFB9|nr:thermonuclease family protein [Roseibium aquae]
MQVVDGDALVVAGERLRLNGIDAPELGQTCHDGSGRKVKCGHRAKAHLERLIAAGSLTCSGDTMDAYDRRIATCFVNGQDINARMVQDGQALAFRKYSNRYVREETAARQTGAGLWNGAFDPPWDYRAARWRIAQADQAAPNGCPIKGNISSNGRIYHPPWSTSYARTRIDPSRGERWFCSEAEALAAGWRPPHGS